MIKSRLIKFNFFSLQFAAVSRDILKDVVSVHRVVWAINVVTLYWDKIVISPNNISNLRLLIYRLINKSPCT